MTPTIKELNIRIKKRKLSINNRYTMINVMLKIDKWKILIILIRNELSQIIRLLVDLTRTVF